MTNSIRADDIEPLDEVERCDAVWGPYHIGRFAESRAELALMFDRRWLASGAMEVKLEEALWGALRRFDGHLHGWSAFGSPDFINERLHRLLCDHLEVARSMDFDPQMSLAVAVVDLPEEGVAGLVEVVGEEPSYVGYGSVSFPSDFRTILYSEMSYT